MSLYDTCLKDLITCLEGLKDDDCIRRLNKAFDTDVDLVQWEDGHFTLEWKSLTYGDVYIQISLGDNMCIRVYIYKKRIDFHDEKFIEGGVDTLVDHFRNCVYPLVVPISSY